MDEKQAVTFALFFYISESPKGHLNLQCNGMKVLNTHQTFPCDMEKTNSNLSLCCLTVTFCAC